MGCTEHNTTYEEMMNKRKRGLYAMVPGMNQTQAETKQRLDFLRDNTSLQDDKYYLWGKLYKVGQRVSEVAKRIVGLREPSVSPDNEIKRKMGTKIHSIVKEIMDFRTKEEGTLADIRTRATSGDYKIDSRHFEQLILLVDQTLDEINEQQQRISKDGKVDIYTEQFVIDFKKDIGGTIDVLAVFSDNTAAVYDYKTTGKETAIGWGKKGYEVKETLLPYYDTQAYDISMTEYKRILLERIGVKSVRQNRLLPIALKYKYKPKEQRDEGSFLKPELSVLLANRNLSEHLKPIPVGGEGSRWTGVNKLLEKQYGLLRDLSKKLQNRSLSIDEKEKIKDRIKNIESTIKKTLVDEDIHSLIQTIQRITIEAQTRLKEPKTIENDVNNPVYPNIGELQDILSEMDVYNNIIQETLLYFGDLQKESESKYDFLKAELHKIEPIFETVYAELRLELFNKIADDIGSEFLNDEGYLKPFKELGFFELQTSKISGIDNPVFQAAWKLVRDSQYEQKQAFMKMDKKVWKATEELWKWAHDNGIKRQDAFDMMINPKTGNLYAKLDKKFYDIRAAAFQDKDAEGLKFLKKSYELRDKVAFKKEYEQRLEAEKSKLKASYNNFEATINMAGKTVRTAKQQKEDYDRAVERFEDRNNLLESSNAWFNSYNIRRYCKITDETMQENYSAEYKKIMSIEPMRNYYEMWTNYMSEFSEMLGITDYGVLPDNFIPNVRKEMAEYLTKDNLNFKATFREFLDTFSVREEDVYLANVDENGVSTQIPVLFVNKLRDKDGKIDPAQKSYELSNSLMVFGKMAYNYKYMNQIEPKISAMKSLMADPSPEQGGMESTDRLSRKIKGKIVPFLTKSGRMTESYKLFQDITDYYLYGIKFKDKTLIPGRDTVHALTKAKNFNSVIKLGFAITPALGALTAGHLGVYITAKKGIAYTEKQLAESVKDMIVERKQTNALAAFFDPYNDDYTDREFQKYKTSMKNKSLDRLLFSFLRRADISNTKKVIISMARNFGIDEKGNIIRLNNPGVDKTKYKTIRESFILDKDGNFSVEGLNKEGFIQFVAAIKSTMGGIIGNMNPDDIGRPDVGFIQNQFFAFRSWMPAVVEERLGRLKYDEAVQSLKWGRFKAYLKEYAVNVNEEYNVTEQEFEDGKKISMYITHVLVPNMAKLVADLSTFGLVPSLVKNRINKARAEKSFYQFLEDNPHLRDKVSFDQYLEIKEAQIRAMLVEMRIILGILSLALFLGGTGDDGEKRYMGNWLSRNLYKTLNKAGSEMTFMWNPKEFARLMKNPFPVTSLVDLAMNTLKNTFDETRDFIAGEDSSRDISPPMYYTLQWMKGGPQLLRFFEVYKNYQKSPYTVF